MLFVKFGLMKKMLLLSCLFPLFGNAQALFAYMDFNNFCRAFYNNNFVQIDHLEVSNLTLGDNVIAYMNAQKDFKIYDGKQTKLITNQFVNFKMSDNIIAWNLGEFLYYWENGKPHNVTSFAGDYLVGDSLIVFQDTRFNTLNAIYKGSTIQLMQQTDEMYMPDAMGDNIVMFRDNGGNYKVFWHGEQYEIGVWNYTQDLKYVAGTDVLAFNDPNTRTFTVFQDGEFLDVEDMYATKMKAGRGFVVYEDIQGNLMYYSKGQKKQLSSFYQSWDVKDDVVVWVESNSTFTLKNEEIIQILNYPIKEWRIKNDVIAFKTNVGGIGASVNGNVKEITNMTNCEFIVNGHGVMVTLPNKSVMILNQGQIYRD